MKLESIVPTTAVYPYGFKLVHVQTTDMNSSYISIRVNSGSFDEPNHLLGVAHFVEHMVFKGSDIETCEQINKNSAMRGIYRNASTSQDFTRFSAKGGNDEFEYMVRSMLHMVFAPAFPEEEFEHEKNVVLTEMTDRAKDDAVYHGVLSNLFHGYSPSVPIIGVDRCVKNTSRDSLISWYRRNYVLSNCVITTVGEMPGSKVFKMIDDVLFNEIHVSTSGKVKHGCCRRKYPADKAVLRCSGDKKMSDEMCVGYHTGGIEEISRRLHIKNRGDVLLCATGIVESMLMNGSASTLFTQAREKRGLCYSVYGYFQFWDFDGLMFVQTSSDHDKKKSDALKKLIENLFAKKWTVRMVKSNGFAIAKKFEIARMRLFCDDAAMIGRTVEAFYKYHPEATMGGCQILSAFDAVTPEFVASLLNIVSDSVSFTCTQLGN